MNIKPPRKRGFLVLQSRLEARTIGKEIFDDIVHRSGGNTGQEGQEDLQPAFEALALAQIQIAPENAQGIGDGKNSGQTDKFQNGLEAKTPGTAIFFLKQKKSQAVQGIGMIDQADRLKDRLFHEECIPAITGWFCW
jgi:hypothetical protein